VPTRRPRRSSSVRPSSALVLVAVASLAACRDSVVVQPLGDMSLTAPTMVWSHNPGMPLGEGRAAMPIVLSPTERRLIGFGGSPTSATDTWAFSLRDDAWSTLVMGAVSPPGRVGHCAAYLPAQNHVVYVGGHDDTGAPQTAPVVLAVGTPGFLSVIGDAPTPASGCSAAYHQVRTSAVVFGGKTNTSVNAETWLYSPSSMSFTRATPAHTPDPRSGGTLVIDPGPSGEATTGRLILFGGASADLELADVWLWNGDDWGELGTTEDPDAMNTDDPRPLGRTGAAVAVDPNRRLMYVFGGTRQGTLLGDLWRLDLRTLTWSRLTVAGGPSARESTSVAYDPILDRLMLFGGRGDSGSLSDGWSLSPAP